MSFTGTILTFAGGCGAPFVGPLGSALTIGSNVLNPDDGSDEVFQELETIQNLVEERFNEVSQELKIIQNQINDLQKTATKNLDITAQIKWEEGLKRVEAFCKNIYARESLASIIFYIDKCCAFFYEIQNDATQHFDEDKLEEYMDFLTEEKGIK